MKKNRVFQFVLYSLISLIFVAGYFPVYFLSKNTTDYKLDLLSYKLNDFYKINYQNNNNPPIMNVKRKDNKRASDLFSLYHYSDLLLGCEEIVDDSTSVSIEREDGETMEIQFQCIVQPSYSISPEKKGDGYYLDFGLFETYFSDDILGPKKYLDLRFNSDAFLFISDKMADSIIDFYGIEEYQTLIKEENYCCVELEVGDKTIIAVINNIIYSSKRSGPRIEAEYGDYAVLYYRPSISPFFTFSFQALLKTNPYTNKTVFKTIDKLGYNCTSSEISFNLYDASINAYSGFDSDIGAELKQNYIDAWSVNYIPSAIGLIFFSISISIILFFVKYKVLRNAGIKPFCVFCLASIILNVIFNFIYTYISFGIYFICFLLFVVILYRKDILNIFKRKSYENSYYYIIEI